MATPIVADHAERRTAESVRPLTVWPLRARGVAIVLAAYVVLAALWTGAGLMIVHVMHPTALGRRETALSTWLESQRTPRLNSLSEYGSLLSDTRTKLVAV